MKRCTHSWQPIGDWDASNADDMRYMLSGARAFNQPIGGWDVWKVKDVACMFDDCPIYRRISHTNTAKFEKVMNGGRL